MTDPVNWSKTDLLVVKTMNWMDKAIPSTGDQLFVLSEIMIAKSVDNLWIDDIKKWLQIIFERFIRAKEDKEDYEREKTNPND